MPAILPGMLQVLRMNLFGAWMVVLVAESTGVGYGMGQVIMLARNTFNPSLVFFTIAVIGVLGFAFDWLLRLAQRRILYWLPRPRRSCVASDALRIFRPRTPWSAAASARPGRPAPSAPTRRCATSISTSRRASSSSSSGPSGCGKSTLLYLIAGLETRPSGRIWSSASRRGAVAASAALIFQETSLFPWLTVVENVELRPRDPRRAAGASAARAARGAAARSA